ncbi:MAG: hypothetical protein R3D27_03515 [Hyphomicrobiaceae bacterium]
MFPATPAKLMTSVAYDPICKLMDGLLLTPAEVATRWRYSDDHLSNLRRVGKGIPFIKFDTGGVRYRAADVIAAELANLGGPLILDDVLTVIAALETVPAAERAKVHDHLKAAFVRRPGR